MQCNAMNEYEEREKMKQTAEKKMWSVEGCIHWRGRISLSAAALDSALDAVVAVVEAEEAEAEAEAVEGVESAGKIGI